ncbi:MAG TPA: hypothetical protein VN829_20000, partial [Dongiaceae bacterium]|nr:hypothetical protein [Dongiaceae bacterium]
MNINRLFLAAALVLRFATASFAQTILWNGNGDGFSWSNPQNWIGGQAHGPSKAAIITNGNGS